MSVIQPRIEYRQAWQRLHGRRWRYLSPRHAVSWWRRGDHARAASQAPHDDQRSAAGRPPCVEIVWLPYYRVSFLLDARDRVEPIDSLVGGLDGSFSLCKLDGLEHVDDEAAGHAQPSIDATAAAAIARDALAKVLALRGPWRRPVAVGEPVKVELIHYPFWVYYFQRRSRGLDVKLLDAITGRQAGGKVKAALFAALSQRPPRRALYDAATIDP